MRNKPSLADKILKSAGLDCNSKTTALPGVKLPVEPGEDALLNAEEHHVYRSLVGLITFYSKLRADLLYALKLCAHKLAAPTVLDQKRLKHLCRYVNGTRDFEMRLEPNKSLPWQLVCPVDSNWGNCEQTRNSTTGAVVTLLGCPLVFR